MARKLPENDWRSSAAGFDEARLSKNLDLAGLLRGIWARHDAYPVEVAIAWTSKPPAAIVGAVDPKSSDDEIKKDRGVPGRESLAPLSMLPGLAGLADFTGPWNRNSL